MVVEAALEGMYKEGVLGERGVSSGVPGWTKRRCLASDAAIRARVERSCWRLLGGGLAAMSAAGWCAHASVRQDAMR